MKFLQWNINGLRSVIKTKDQQKEIIDFFSKYDLISLNETKIDNDAMLAISDKFVPQKYYLYSSHATKRGYSGVCIISKYKALHEIKQTLGNDEGRIVILEFKSCIVMSVYVPNSGQRTKTGDKLPKRIEYRTRDWDPHFMHICASLQQKKPLIVLGDMNVAHKEIDIHNPSLHKYTAGFTDVERSNFDLLLNSTGMIDIWRDKHKKTKQYTYFDYRTRARQRNAGWRLDYILISKKLQESVSSCEILANSSEGEKSDHVPVLLNINIDLSEDK